MNHPRFFVSTVVLFLLVFTVATFAQEREGRGRDRRSRGVPRRSMHGGAAPRDKIALLRSGKVRQEVKVTQEQAKKIDKILQSHEEESEDLGQIFNAALDSLDSSELSTEEVAEKITDVIFKRSKLKKKTIAALEGGLEKQQVARLNEIDLQQQGTRGLLLGRCVAALKLSKGQVKKIKSTVESRDEAMRELRPRRRLIRRRRPDSDEGGGGGISPKEIRGKIGKLNKDTHEAALAILSSEQREAFKKLKGKPFKFGRHKARRAGDRPDRDRRGASERRKRQRPPSESEG